MTPQNIIDLIYHRALEIDVWIIIRCLVCVSILLVAVALAVRAFEQKSLGTCLGVCMLCTFWVCIESPCQYYIQINGKQARHLENLHPHAAHMHENRRATESTAGKISAAAGFFLPFLLLLIFACHLLFTEHAKNNGKKWAWISIACFIGSWIFYGWVSYWASRTPT